MPYYKFKNKDTNEISEVLLKISELDSYKEEHPELERYFDAVGGLADPISLGIQHPPRAFQEHLGRIYKQAGVKPKSKRWDIPTVK